MINRKNTIIIFCALAVGIGLGLILMGLISNPSFAGAKQNQPTENYYTNTLANPPLPDSMTFADEPVPLDKYWVKEALDRELTIVCYQHSTTLLGLKRSARCFPVIEKILKEEGLPQDFKYLCIAESNLSNAISPAKAVGYWQFIAETAKIYGLEINTEVDERYNLEKSTRAACKYLKASKQRLGSWALAAAAYNMGEAGVKRSIDNQNVTDYWDMYLNPETARYVYRILSYKLLFENAQTYGVKLLQNEKYAPITYEEIEVKTTIPDLYQFCRDHDITYRELKELNPWLRAKKLTVNTKTYYIKIPVKKK